MESASANGQNYPNNKPDTIIRDNEIGTCMSMHIATVRADNVIKREAGKFVIYKYLNIEIQRIWSLKLKVIPVHKGAT